MPEQGSGKVPSSAKIVQEAWPKQAVVATLIEVGALHEVLALKAPQEPVGLPKLAKTILEITWPEGQVTVALECSATVAQTSAEDEVEPVEPVELEDEPVDVLLLPAVPHTASIFILLPTPEQGSGKTPLLAPTEHEALPTQAA